MNTWFAGHASAPEVLLVVVLVAATVAAVLWLANTT